MTSGNELSLLLKFSVPMLIGNIFQQFYNMVDSIIVGNYVGKNALAAVGMTSSLNFLYFSLCNGFATGAGVLMAQYFGMKNEKRVKDCIGNSVYLLFGMGLLVSVISFHHFCWQIPSCICYIRRRQSLRMHAHICRSSAQG